MDNDVLSLLTDMKESLEREIRSVGERVDRVEHKVDGLVERFDTLEARMKRQGALIQTGGRLDGSHQ